MPIVTIYFKEIRDPINGNKVVGDVSTAPQKFHTIYLLGKITMLERMWDITVDQSIQ